MPSVSASPAAQYGASQVQLQQAKRNAAQAEQTANALEAAARSAKEDALRATDRARSLEARSDRAASVADRARQGLAAINTRDATANRLQSTLDNVLARVDVAPTSDSAKAGLPEPRPVVNTQGETTGQIVNTTA